MGQWERRLETHGHDTPTSVPRGTAVGSTWRCSCGTLFRYKGIKGVQWDPYVEWEQVVEERYGMPDRSFSRQVNADYVGPYGSGVSYGESH